MRAFLIYWLPVLIWMSMIFTASGDSHSYQHSSRFFEPLLHWLFPRMSQPWVETIHECFRKCCHLAEYSIFSLLLWRAFSRPPGDWRAWSWPKVRFVLLIICVYAASDEFHQVFVPTRTARVTDVMIDTTGGSLGLLALWLLQRYWKPRIRN
ncbi:MAG TPA: VanZ family protein [Verrucomicrobiae bacterium]